MVWKDIMAEFAIHLRLSGAPKIPTAPPAGGQVQAAAGS